MRYLSGLTSLTNKHTLAIDVDVYWSYRYDNSSGQVLRIKPHTEHRASTIYRMRLGQEPRVRRV